MNIRDQWPVFTSRPRSGAQLVPAIVAFFAWVLAIATEMHGQVPASEKRLWVLDLGSVQAYSQLKLKGREVAKAASVVFVDANTLAVTYRIANPTSPEATDAVSFFDARSGAFRNSLQWPTTEQSSADRNLIRVLPTRGGEFLVVVGYSIRRYSTTQKELRSRGIIPGDERNWVVSVSPDGEMALLKRLGPGLNEDHWFSTETLEDRLVEPAPFYSYGYAVGQGFVVYNPASTGDKESRLIHVHSSSGRDRVLCAECQGAAIGIVNDRIFFGGLPAGTGVVVASDGKTLLRNAFGREHQPISQVSVARESARIAFYMAYLRRAAISRIVVLDTATLREVRRIDFEDPGQEIGGGGVQWFWPGIAISPDGTKLALLWKTESPQHTDKIEVFPLTDR